MSYVSSLPNLILFADDRQLAGTSNWVVFKDNLQVVARSSGLLGYLTGSIIAPLLSAPTAAAVAVPPAVPTAAPAVVATPINSRNPSVEEWELRDGRLAGIIYQNVKDPRSIGLDQIMSAHQMWNTLTAKFDSTSAASQTLAKERIQQHLFVPGTSFEEYFGQIKALQKAASDVGCRIDESDLRSRFLTSLPEDHFWIIQAHGGKSYNDMINALIDYDLMIKSTRAKTTSSNPTALATTHGSGIICDNCQRNGHSKKNCWAKGGGSEGKAPRWYHAPKGLEPTKSSSSHPPSIPDTSTIAAAAIYVSATR